MHYGKARPEFGIGYCSLQSTSTSVHILLVNVTYMNE